jgi:hypothetical protein
MIVVIKGLPADHSLSKCMGKYVEQAERQDDRPTFVGGRCDDMLLSFSIGCGWTVCDKGDQSATLLYSNGIEVLPHLVMSAWTVCEQRKDSSSVRVEKFKKRDTMLKLSGGQSSRYGAFFEGIYRKQDRIHDSKSTYVNEGRFIWFQEGFGWCVGIEEQNIGTRSCAAMHADDFAPTPDAVQSGWKVLTESVKDPRVQAVLASAEHPPSLMEQHYTPAPVLSLSIPDPTALEDIQHPAMLALVGVGEGYSGLYKKQQRLQDGKVRYEGSRADGNRWMYYYSAGGLWRIGPIGSNGTLGCFISADSSNASPHTFGAVWRETVMEACNSVRVTKSKKKHTKVIEVKGVPAEYEMTTQTNGKYRQQALTIDGRPTFKGGKDGNQAIWYSESAGSWRIGDGSMVGTAVHHVHAKDTASTPNAVKSTWEVVNALPEPNPYAKIVLPSVEAAEQEVPRQMQLKMAEVLVAEQRRCLGCGHEYALQEEVVYHDDCMHHHCMFCCETEQGSCSCTVCAAEKGK